MSPTNEPIERQIAARLAALRGQLSQAVFADRLGLTPKTIQRWEAGVAIPDGDSLLSLWREFQADPGWVLTGSSDAPTLATDEQELLARYRSSSQELRRAALGMLREGSKPERPVSVSQVFRGKVGTAVSGGSGDVHVTIKRKRDI